MTFKFTVNPKMITVEFESGSVAEAVSIFQDQKTALGQIFNDFREVQALCGEIDTTGGAVSTTTTSATEAAGTKKPRGRPPASAQAPAPAAVPAAAPAAAAPPPPLPVAPPVAPAAPAAFVPPPTPPGGAVATAAAAGTAGLEIPAFLDRRNEPAAPVAPPPPAASVAPPAPPAPPPAPAAPAAAAPGQVMPGGPLADAIIKECRKRAEPAIDKGQSLADWLIACGIDAAKGSTFDEVLACLPFTMPDKLAPIAGPNGLNIAV
jgi:hypothetical protein